MKTHGECWFEQKQDVDLSKKQYDNVKALPPRMKHEDAVRYYNTKLFAYWIDRLDDQISIERKAKMIGYLMFGDHTRETIFKDKQDECVFNNQEDDGRKPTAERSRS